ADCRAGRYCRCGPVPRFRRGALPVRLAGRGYRRKACGMTRFANKVALVTGGRSGIGLAIARRLRDEGARVFTAQRGADTEFEGIAADLADPRSAARILDEVVREGSRLDVLVNNAGVMQEARVEDMSLADWERTLAVNLTAPFMLIKAALPHLRSVR